VYNFIGLSLTYLKKVRTFS